MIRNASRAVMALYLVVTLAACGATAQQKAMRIGLRSLDTSMAGLTAWSAAEQQSILDDSSLSVEQKVEAVKLHRENRDRVVAVFAIAYSALALAALDPTPANLAAAAEEAAKAYQAVRTLIGDK